MELWHVSNTPGEASYAVDLHFTADDGSILHVWQTNADDLALYEKDPSVDPEGQPEVIDNGLWNVQWLEDRQWFAFSHKFTLSDGQTITLSAAGNLSDEILRRIAASFE